VFAREILDSRGNPTVEVEVVLEGGSLGRAAVPSGASTGAREAVELRDGDKKRFLGKGVRKAVAAVNDALSGTVIGEDALDQALIDQLMIELDGTDSKKRLGANAILAVSMAVAKAAADASGMPLYRYVGGVNARTLPVPFMNIINGGAHADNKLDPQEFMIVPHGFATFSEALRAGVEVFHHLKAILKKKGESTAVGDEGGFAPDLDSSEEALEAILSAVKAAGYKAGSQISLALDVAASELWDGKKYVFKKSGGAVKSSDQMVAMYQKWVKDYPIVSIEDGVGEKDGAGWAALLKALNGKV
jgi:enolase